MRSTIVAHFIIIVCLLTSAAMSQTDQILSMEQNIAPNPASPPIPPVVELPLSPIETYQRGGWPPIKMISPGVFEMGGVQILKNKQQVVFPAAVNMDRGLLEYLIVGSSGKVHESLLRTDVEPYCLHIAMLLVGFEGSSDPLAVQGDPNTPKGDPVNILVEWKDREETREARIEEWVLNKREGAPLKPMQWVFTGSIVSDGIFMAQIEKSIAALFHDPLALIDNPLPEGGNDELWFVNESRVPATGTPVTVTVERADVR